MAKNLSSRLMIRPSDASAWASCLRRIWLDKHQTEGIKIEASDFDKLIRDAGHAHETAVLATLQQQYNDVHTAYSAEQTHALMQQKVAVIYQGRLLDEQEALIGHPDFLIRHEGGQYQPADAKLSHSANKKNIQIQLGLYRRILGNQLPAMVFLGNGDVAMLGSEIDAVVDIFIDSMRKLLSLEQPPVVRYSHSKCRICPYYGQCLPEFEAAEDISLLYGLHGRAANNLQTVGLTTISQLANSQVEAIPDVPYLKGKEKKQRAILQAKSILSGEVFQQGKIDLPKGTWIHFDIEDNPLTPSRERHVYLWGLLPPAYSKHDFVYIWTNDESQDYQGWVTFLETVEQYRKQYSSLILAHYSNHEKATIKKYAERYAMTNHATVLWLLGNKSPLFDLQKPILNNLILPSQGYGLKDICKHKDLVNFQWEDDDSGSQWSVVQFNRFLTEKNPVERQKLKTDILGYNRDDVTATRRLEEWLRRNFSRNKWKS